MGEEAVGHRLEGRSGQVAVALRSFSPRLFSVVTPCPRCAARISAPSSALRSLLDQTAPIPPTQSCDSIARIRARPRSDSRQSGTGIAGSMTTSGWVMKRIVGTGQPSG
jgi:hypothetical protein